MGTRERELKMAITMDPISTLAAEVPEEQRTEQLDGALLRRLYSYMLKCRMIEERIRLASIRTRYCAASLDA